MEDPLDLIKDADSFRTYAHFDDRISFYQAESRVTDPEYVAKHSFFPLIRRKLKRSKRGENGEWIDDPRVICYAAHIDRCIYQYYSALLNIKYNEIAIELGIDDSSIAYRTNHKGMSNCSFASKAFSEIRNREDCYVLVGDFTHFFDNLDHVYLKKQVRRLFDTGHIPDDYYRVFKSATRYSAWDIEDLLELRGLPYSKTGMKRFNQKRRALRPRVFRQNVKRYAKHPWKDSGGGVPQGLSVSGVLANIYMLEFDTEMQELARKSGALYMRYSDDFILVAEGRSSFDAFRALIGKLCVSIPGLMLKEEKTKLFRVEDRCVIKLMPSSKGSLDSEGLSRIDYLGFTFDGESVALRQRTIGRYYGRMYRRIGGMYRWERPSRRRVEELYLAFSGWGKNPRRNCNVRKKCRTRSCKGNFLTYVDRAQRIFPNDPITKDTVRHKRKMRARCKRTLRARAERQRKRDSWQ